MNGSEPGVPTSPPVDDDVVRAAHAHLFEDAWQALAERCSDTIAPEATYQAWLAHFLIERLDLLRIVREVDFGVRHLGEAAQEHFSGNNLMADVLVLREPIVNLPRRAALGQKVLPGGGPNPRSGLARLKDFSVITELKVSATQMEGLDYGEVLRDFRKLSYILDAAEDQYPGQPLPAAFVGVLDNHPKRRFNFALLDERVQAAGVRPDVQLLRS
jgi:hypothetical protein